MKKQMIILLLALLIFPVAGCQPKEKSSDPVEPTQLDEQPATISLADIPDSKNMTFTVEGEEESVTMTKALHDDFYAMYYDTNGFAYVPGEVLDTGFSDAFISVYDDETTMVLTTMKVCYTTNSTPEQWIESTFETEWAPQADIASFASPSWVPSDQIVSLGQKNQNFQTWITEDTAGVTNLCYTTSFRNGCLAVIVSYPDEEAEGWGNRMQTMAQSLVLAAE